MVLSSLHITQHTHHGTIMSATAAVVTGHPVSGSTWWASGPAGQGKALTTQGEIQGGGPEDHAVLLVHGHLAVSTQVVETALDQDKAGQMRTNEDKAGQTRTNEDKEGQMRTNEDKEDNEGQMRTNKDKAEQTRTNEDKQEQMRTKQSSRVRVRERAAC